jgi:hypothetical protein
MNLFRQPSLALLSRNEITVTPTYHLALDSFQATLVALVQMIAQVTMRLAE